MIKEFRYWNKQLTTAELLNWRSKQIDPTYVDSGLLLTYIRLATGSSLIENFAESNPIYNFEGTNPRISGASFVEDYIDEERYSYDPGLE